jgi:hypothetical protein
MHCTAAIIKPHPLIKIIAIGRKLPGVVLINNNFVKSMRLPAYFMARRTLGGPIRVLDPDGVTNRLTDPLGDRLRRHDAPGNSFNGHMPAFGLARLTWPNRRIARAENPPICVRKLLSNPPTQHTNL